MFKHYAQSGLPLSVCLPFTPNQSTKLDIDKNGDKDQSFKTLKFYYHEKYQVAVDVKPLEYLLLVWSHNRSTSVHDVVREDITRKHADRN